MEPEIIRMYSSSPPPLDSVADDDEEDEFGEFGGFSEVNNSGIGFVDFDTVNFPKSREDFIPSKHFLPIHDYTDGSVNNFASLTSIKAGENVSEISSSKKGLSSVFESNTNHETTQFNVAALDNKGSSGEIETPLNSETHMSSADNANLVSRGEDQIDSTCNGEKIHSLENLTNGFTVVDSTNPQGLQDKDSMGHSKGFKTISSHSTDLSIDFSPPSPGDDFADFATFSSKDTVDLDDTEQQAHIGLHDVQVPSIKVNTKLSRSEDGIVSAHLEVLNDPVSRDLSSVNPPLEQVILTLGSVPPPYSMAPETSISDSMHSTDTKTTPGLTHSNNEDVLQSFDGDGSLARENSLDRKELALNLHKESENTNIGNISHNQPEYDSSFGDFNAATEESPPPLTDSSELSNTYFHAPLDLDMNELEDEFDDFRDINNGSFYEEQTVTLEKVSLPSIAEEQSQQKPSEETDEFNDFVSLEKKEEWNTVQASNDFADFGTEGSFTQPSEWNAFEDDQGESLSWAAFEDQKTDSEAKSDDWKSFRTDVPPGTDSQVINSESVDLSTFHDSESNLVCEDSTLAFQVIDKHVFLFWHYGLDLQSWGGVRFPYPCLGAKQQGIETFVSAGISVSSGLETLKMLKK